MGLMSEVAQAVKIQAPYVMVWENDNISSSVQVVMSLDARETWKNGILENSRFAKIMIRPQGRYFDGGRVTVESISGLKMRKFTGDWQKVVTKLNKWANEQI